MTLKEQIRHSIPAAIVVVIGAWVMIYYSIVQWETMKPVPSWDLAIFSELAKAYAHFQTPIVPVKGDGYNLLGDHFHPILILLGPIWRLFPTPLSLLITQDLLLAFSAWPLTRLASRLRESGLTVYGFGEKKTPEAFRKACDKFVYTEIFRPEKQRQEKEKNNGKNNPAAEESAAAPDALPLLKRAVRENADDLGWANLGPIGSYISKINPDFDSRLYGYGKLSDLIKSFDIFEHRTDNNQLQVRRRKSADKPTERSSENPFSSFQTTFSYFPINALPVYI